MNKLRLETLFLIISSILFLTACSKVGDLVSNTGEFVSKTGKIIGGEKEKPKVPEAGEALGLPKIKEAKPATAIVHVKATDKLSQSRISITILQLKSGGKFLSSRLSELESDAESALGSDFINKQTVSLKRGESKSLNFEIDSTTKTIGAFASFQELNQTIWRTGVQLPKATNASYTIQINVDKKSISAVKK